ncbi:RagB/SusD family nutrient uptake outer membrane protein [Pleomorphovibrio marinus]|uniref:RagB/SusD family nutrient uptake outer membrane protein n=1 Tax=Pleomorphovibrio marinus TaxID=2164132 RepID=UPI000E0B2454|nr:RagB/SusD family nutrient uptake outer membrane protein [Pleomorphovibrio marinus]
MKNIKKIFTVMLLLVFAASGCNEDNIDLDPIGDTEASFFNNETQMNQAVLGIYQKVGFFYTFRGGQNNWIQSIWLAPSDDLTTRQGHEYEFFQGLQGSLATLNNFYRFAYQLIARANVVLQKIEENGDFAYESQPELRDFHKGEALFLRAWMNFRLWNVYGTAPLVNERIVALENAYPPNSSGTELLDQVIVDLEEAAQLLPSSWNPEFRGRVTRNSALGLRAKALVFRGTVTGSEADFTAAIQNVDAMSGMELMPNYGDNFDAAMENNAESLFEFQANQQSGLNNTSLDNDSFAVVGDTGAYWGMFANRPSWIGNAIYTATESLKNAYESGDPRTEYIFDPTPGLRLNVRKYIRDGNWTNDPGGANGSSRNNPRILRYADILLIKAEAITRSGGSLSDALEIINQIRERARNSTLDGIPAVIPADRPISADRNQVLEWLFLERRLELAIEEGHRYYDLRRRHMAGEVDLTNWDWSSERNDAEWRSFNINFPLPDGEVIDNANMSQNLGY